MAKAEAGATEDDPQEAVRTEILRHAHDLFRHYGFNKTNIGDIAERCGMSPGNLYRYFRNKQAIGLAAIQQYFRQAEAAMDTVLIIPGGSAEERIRRFINTGIGHIVAKLEASPKIVELAEFLCDDDEGWEILQEHIVWRRQRIAREIARGVASGELRPCDAERTAIALQNAIKVFWMPMTLARWRDPSTVMPELDEVLELLFRGMRA